ncbi:MAG: hypothetical protein K0S08_500 [Gammaproteobacteria bacterium]|jgi:putative membrane protein|nr:hypothetical protein [Gammaproteobacteria bacterium]
MLWIMAFHIISMVTWFAGLFYLPRLYVYHAMTNDPQTSHTFKTMERKLFFGIMTPGAVLTIFFGVWLYLLNPSYYLHQAWMWLKLFSVLCLVIFHACCGYYWWQFKQERNCHGHKFYRFFNEIPTIFLFVIIIMVIVKPVMFG